MKRSVAFVWVLLTLAGAWAMPVPLIRAQEPVYLRTVEPSEGQPGQELELTLLGGGFGEATKVRVFIGEIEVLDAWKESDEAVIAYVFIPEDAPPGPRTVEVIAVFEPDGEFPAVLEAGFSVLEPEGPPLPDQPALYEVAPREVAQGSEVELTLFGENFVEEIEVFIHGGGVEVRESHFADPSRLIVQVAVSADAETGPRLVELITEGGRADLPNGLIVIERGSPSPSPPAPPSPPSPNGIPSWVWPAVAILLGGLGGVIGRTLALRTRLTWERIAQLQWQVEATKELPEPKEACTWACQAKATADLLARWNVTALELTPLPLPSGKSLPAKRLEGAVLAPLNEATGIQHVLEDEDQTRRRIAPVVDTLLERILAWKAEGQTPASIRVDAHLAGDIECGFRLCHCEKTAKGLDWVERMKWKGTLHEPAGECLGVLRGPTAGEPDFAARAREELEGFLLKLIRGVRFKL